MAEVKQEKKKWYRIQWYADIDTPEERRLILKLDLLIVPFAILAYWCKTIDSANLSMTIVTTPSLPLDIGTDFFFTDTAYVSGLKEDLGFIGNELVQLQTLYTLGAVLGAIPFSFLFTYIPMNWCIPLMDIAWGIVTLLQFRAASYSELAAYRFLVGWFEVRLLISSGKVTTNFR